MCGRTACTDRGGGGRKPAPVGIAARRWRLPPTLHRTGGAGVSISRGITANPTKRWVEQQACNLLITARRVGAAAALPRSRPRRQVHVPPRRRVPVRVGAADSGARGRAQGEAARKRWVGSVRRECLDRLLIVSRKHLERVLRLTRPGIMQAPTPALTSAHRHNSRGEADLRGCRSSRVTNRVESSYKRREERGATLRHRASARGALVV